MCTISQKEINIKKVDQATYNVMKSIFTHTKELFEGKTGFLFFLNLYKDIFSSSRLIGNFSGALYLLILTSLQLVQE